MLHDTLGGVRIGGDRRRRDPGRRRATAVPSTSIAVILFLALGACSETSLNEAPVIDLSSRAGARPKAPPPAADATYTVQKGDTLFHLAGMAHASMHDLAQWNGIDEHAPLFVGQHLRLQPPAGSVQPAVSGSDVPPASATDTAAPGDAIATPIPIGGGGGVETRALDAAPSPSAAPTNNAMQGGGGSAPGVFSAGGPGAAAPAPTAGVGLNPSASMSSGPSMGSSAAIAPPAISPAAPPAVPPDTPAPAVGAAGLPAPPSAATTAWVWPASGEVTGKFDPVRTKGIEIAAPEDSPIVAVADGTVSYTGSPRDYGNLVILKHGDELLSVYAHAKTILVKEGQAVRRGQTIATAGRNGNVPATVHFEARRNHVAVDPLELLPLR